MPCMSMTWFIELPTTITEILIFFSRREAEKTTPYQGELDGKSKARSSRAWSSPSDGVGKAKIDPASVPLDRPARPDVPKRHP